MALIKAFWPLFHNFKIIDRGFILHLSCIYLADMSSGNFSSMQKHEISSFNFSLNWTKRVVNCVFRKVKRTKEDVTLERQDPFCGLFDQAAEHS